jgi:hypothetical protein
MINYLIKRGADDWNSGLMYSALGGHKDLIDYFVAKGANDWLYALNFATQGGHLELVKLFMKKIKIDAQIINWLLYYAVKGGHMNVINYVISLGANNWNLAREGLLEALDENLLTVEQAEELRDFINRKERGE